MFKWCAGAVLSASVVLAALPAVAAPPPQAFTGFQTTQVTVSPSGRYVAMITATDKDTSALTVGTFADGRISDRVAISLGSVRAVNVSFKSDDQLLVTVIQKDISVAGARWRDNTNVTIDRTVVLVIGRDGGSGKILMPDSGFGASVQEVLPDDPSNVLLSIFENGSYATSLFKVNIETGEFEKVERGRFREQGPTRFRRFLRTIDWQTTQDGTAYLRYDRDDTRNTIEVYGRPLGGGWKLVANYPIVDGAPAISFSGLASPTTVYAFDRAGQDRRAVWEYDLTSGKPIKQIAADSSGEAIGILYNQYKGDLLGARFITNGQIKDVYSGRAPAAAQKALDESFAQYALNQIVDYSRDFGVILVRSEGPAMPPVYTLLDARRMEVSPVGQVRPLDPKEMGQVQTIRYPSSDGREIVAFLTTPPGGGKSLPLVVMPHGGPEAQDTLEFESWRQFLASRGYAVLQPQFRGSDGFGLAHEVAGHGTWGTLVQDDVRAGIDLLARQGTIDADRMCIFGWSYGGYMALAGAALSPGLYKCAISGAGVADLPKMLNWVGKEAGVDSSSYAYWRARMGSDSSRELASPTRQAGNVTVPVLLIHGEDDQIVPIEQSELMEAALKKSGKTVTFKRVPGEGHSFEYAAHTEMLTVVEAFLAQNLAR